MFEIHNYSSFIITILAFQLLPGPGTFTILNATACDGVNAGMRSVLGTITGDLIYMLGAVLGLAAVLSMYPSVLAIAQWIGVVYLCWLGLKFLCLNNFEMPSNALQKGYLRYYRQALAVSLTNPKVITFFMAFFPLFLSKNSSPVTLFILMLHVSIISFIYQTCLVLLGNTIVHGLSRWKWIRLLGSKFVGVVFIGFGIKLAKNIG